MSDIHAGFFSRPDGPSLELKKSPKVPQVHMLGPPRHHLSPKVPLPGGENFPRGPTGVARNFSFTGRGQEFQSSHPVSQDSQPENLSSSRSLSFESQRTGRNFVSAENSAFSGDFVNPMVF